MKRFNNYLLVSVIGVLTVACHDKRTDHVTEQPASAKKTSTTVTLIKQKVQQHKGKVLTKKVPIQNKAQSVNSRLTLAKQQHYQINEQIFSTKTGTFIRGTLLYNIALHQQVRITGAIVIVLYPNNTLPEKIARLGSVSKIAKNTFKIKYPVKKNMLMAYQQLKKLPAIKIVEMGLDYTPQNKQALK